MHLTREGMLGEIADLPLSILRLSQVYGSGDPHNAYGPNRMIRSALTAGKIFLYGTGEETRDHVHIRDVAKLLYDVLMMRSVGVVNVATGRSVSFAHIAEIVRRTCGGEIVHDPRRVPVTHRVFDTSALEAAFPGRTWTALESGIAITARSEAAALGTADTRHLGGSRAVHPTAATNSFIPDSETP
jgi:UDP-glucose 4-epimerase